ncbi:MAG: TolC family protein [Planctomycetes bacterium]|nr:TolC family protein [Planctomycetota bacterium]
MRTPGLFSIALLGVAGCTSASYSEQRREADELRDALGWGAPRDPFDPADLSLAEGSQPPLHLEGELTIDRVTDEVVRRNPNVVAAFERWVAFLERAPQRTALPDPWLRYGYSSMFKMHTVELMQEVPFPEKLLAEGRAALAEARGMRAELAERTNQLREQAARSLAVLHVARREVQLADENLGLLERFIEIARTRYAAGQATQSDVLRAEVERDGLRAERAGFVRDVELAASALNVLLDRAPDAPLGPVAPLPEPATPEALSVLFERAFRLRPELAAFRSRWEAEREMLSRAELEWVPDVVFGGAYVRDFGEDENEIELTGGISLPIWWGRIRAGVRESEANVRRAEAETRAARNRVLDEVRAAASRLHAASEQHRIVRDQALPRARQNVEVSETAYVSGQLDFLALIDARRMLLSQQLELERTRGERSIAEAELRRAVGDSTIVGGAP